MKKVLVLTAAFALVATSAMAAITNTKHDLAAGSTDTGVNGTATEICVYCHTPHGATAAGVAPLWNRNVPTVASVYSNSSFSQTIALGDVQSSDAPLCLSCHDGASLTGTLNNPPNSGGTNPAAELTGNLVIGTALNNDHPVGFSFAAADTADAEIQAPPATVPVNFGATTNQMWCSSCHDVHGGVASTPFLVMSNAGSALCLACHIK